MLLLYISWCIKLSSKNEFISKILKLKQTKMYTTDELSPLKYTQDNTCTSCSLARLWNILVKQASVKLLYAKTNKKSI